MNITLNGLIDSFYNLDELTEQEIKLTRKMIDMVGTYYHNEERINKIKELLDSVHAKETV